MRYEITIQPVQEHDIELADHFKGPGENVWRVRCRIFFKDEDGNHEGTILRVDTRGQEEARRVATEMDKMAQFFMTAGREAGAAGA